MSSERLLVLIASQTRLYTQVTRLGLHVGIFRLEKREERVAAGCQSIYPMTIMVLIRSIIAQTVYRQRQFIGYGRGRSSCSSWSFNLFDDDDDLEATVTPGLMVEISDTVLLSYSAP